MKNILLIACLFVGLNTVAQNRLEFNQVISLSGSLSASLQSIQLDTVPLGKAYKITAWNTGGTYVIFNINNLIFPHAYSNATSQFPIWLKEGDVLGVQNTYSQGNGGVYHISGIEFNIVTD